MKNPQNPVQPEALHITSDRTATPKKWLAMLYGRIRRWYLRRRHRQIMLALSDDQLKDIGLSRSEIFSKDPY